MHLSGVSDEIRSKARAKIKLGSGKQRCLDKAGQAETCLAVDVGKSADDDQPPLLVHLDLADLILKAFPFVIEFDSGRSRQSHPPADELATSSRLSRNMSRQVESTRLPPHRESL
jgi:hypothetical protein